MNESLPDPVDPSEVRVGDQVQIEAKDGSWMVRAPVTDVDNLYHDGPRYPEISPFGVMINKLMWWPIVTATTVRVLRRAEPEPDEAAVEALAEKVRLVRDHRNWGDDSDETLARELIRRGVRVVSTDA